MGWLEFLGYLDVMRKQRRGGEPDPDRWTEASESNFAELRQKRDRARGR